MNSTEISRIRYAHTNLIATDWKALADFYVAVFGCVKVGAERDNHGAKIDQLTGVAGARVRGQHLRLPGHGDNGPTLEIFQYARNETRERPAIHRPGFAHVAFEVPDVEAVRQQVHAWGGRDYGELVTIDFPGAGRLTLLYVTDPEGNIVELQKWH
jgi:catechol 2,3-dioxygenase-like lactoylglutathione lyase family enzyme